MKKETLNVADWLTETETIGFEWKGKEIEIEFQGNALTPEFAKELDLVKGDEFTEHLAAKIKGWNLSYQEGDFPPTLENLNRLPISFIQKMTETITGVWLGKPAT